MSQSLGETFDMACADPGCGRAWAFAVGYCPYCGRKAEAGTRPPAPPSSKRRAEKPDTPTGAARPVQVLPQGANAPVAAGPLSVVLLWGGAGLEVDASAYLLNAQGRVRSDADMVFFNQVAAENEAVVLRASDGGRTEYAVDPTRLSAAVCKVVFCLTVTDVATGAPAVASAAKPIAITVEGAAGSTALRYDPEVAGGREDALILGELYRRGDAWKFRAVGQGFAGGLARLAGSFGVEVEG